MKNIHILRYDASPLLVVLTLGTLLLAGCNDKSVPVSMAPPEVSAAQVVVKPVTQWDEYSGRIEAIQSVELRPRVSGYLESVNYREGQEVKQGDVLFTIDARNYRAELARANAQFARATSVAAQSRNEARRAKVLVAQHAISTELWEQRNAADKAAQADMMAAQAAVDTAQLNLEWTQVRAPIVGRAGRALVTKGNLVTADGATSVLTTLVSQDKMYAYFDIDENAFLRYTQRVRTDLGGNSATIPVQVGLSNEEGFLHSGEVDFLDNRVQRSSGTLRVRAILDNKDRILTPGLFARVRLQGGRIPDAVLIDNKALLTDQDRKYVYVVDKDGKAQRRDVIPGREAEGLRIIEKGLVAGDRVIIEGYQKVFMPGMPVNAREVPMQGAAALTAAMK
ncbi:MULTISPECIES: efflux RND transporter periplasmic adaptor subunit [Aeromonas]|uniref:efflux RND transporter periplasmic adaptor subunit n=1 Tax=Aeromonas TaxID=642 RepID=UPI000B597DF6|nr:efflux transporter periplasmic adaptor subunit [Aeromonas salmonicida]QYH28385.1 efflux RND transporter periplasmic adaptor subunit [Aeromonas salmonicida subsp. masoucida]QYH32702.1 efflux RND transporter periplasmic adaptor subunit [Aeromonas salmonicida subsp. masoucida]HDN9471721.1 efflux RND transporter periplasmic adaptor subunit [Aeromonas salmonicida]HDN9475524.1 efflux RND transporter periplasmic adaptor subunit [Aeromonas salmonicida]